MFKAPFSFNGRIRRIEYFLSGIVFSCLVCFLGLFAFIIGEATGSSGGWIIELLAILSSVASVWFSLAQGVKRLHDLNKSGWWILLCCVPVVGWIFGLYMLFADGTVGPNQYGEDPKNRMPYQPQPTSVNVTVNIAKEDSKEDMKAEEKAE